MPVTFAATVGLFERRKLQCASSCMLTARLLREREGESDSIFDSLRPIGEWFRRTITGAEVPKN